MMLPLTLQHHWLDEESASVALYWLQGQTTGLKRVSVLMHALILCKVFISSRLLFSSLWVRDNKCMCLSVVYQD